MSRNAPPNENHVRNVLCVPLPHQLDDRGGCRFDAGLDGGTWRGPKQSRVERRKGWAAGLGGYETEGLRIPRRKDRYQN